jgi:hypothetical protein
MTRITVALTFHDLAALNDLAAHRLEDVESLLAHLIQHELTNARYARDMDAIVLGNQPA